MLFVLPIVLPIELPIELPIVLAWFKMLLGLGGEPGWWGGGGQRGFVIKKNTFSKKSVAAKVPI